MQLRANMTSAPVSVEPVNGKFVPGDEDVTVVVVVGARVASACTVVGVEVLAVEPKSPIGVVGTVGIDVDVVLLVEVLEVDVLELVDDVLLLVEVLEVDVLELVEVLEVDVLLLVEVLEVDVLELVDDVLEVDVLELLEEVGSSPPAQNETWLMVGGCPPPFSGGCNPLPLVAAGAKGYEFVSAPPFTRTSFTAIVEVKSNVSSSNGSGPVTLVKVNVCPATVNDALPPTFKPLKGLVSTLISVVPGGQLRLSLAPAGRRMIAMLPTRPADRTPSPSATRARLLAIPADTFWPPSLPRRVRPGRNPFPPFWPISRIVASRILRVEMSSD
jgi:hypothetical protein